MEKLKQQTRKENILESIKGILILLWMIFWIFLGVKVIVEECFIASC